MVSMTTPHFVTGFYTPAQSDSQSYDFFPSEQDAAPLFIWIHGGAWRFGDKGSMHGSPNGQPRLLNALLEAGFAVASINYRLSDEALFPAQLNDVKAAIRYFKSHANEFKFDPAKVLIGGGSAGGHLAMLAAGTCNMGEPYYEGISTKAIDSEPSSNVLACLSVYGVSDLRTIFEDRPLCGVPLIDAEDDGAEWRLLGSHYPAPAGSVAEINWAKAHPIDLARHAQPSGVNRFAPTFLVHGLSDTVVPYIQSQRVHEALAERGIESQLVLVEHANHADQLCFAPEIVEQAVAWLKSLAS